jgi:hypothetical protein
MQRFTSCTGAWLVTGFQRLRWPVAIVVIAMDTSLSDIYRLLASLSSEHASFRAEFRQDQALREQERLESQRRHLSVESAIVEIRGQLQSLNDRVASSITPSSSQLTSNSRRSGDTQQTSTSHTSFDSSLSPEEGCQESAALWQEFSEQPSWATQPQRLAIPPQDPVTGGSPAEAGMAFPTLPDAVNAPLSFTFVAPSASACSQADTVDHRVTVSMPTQNPKQCPLCLYVFQHKRFSKTHCQIQPRLTTLTRAQSLQISYVRCPETVITLPVSARFTPA